LWRAQIFSKQGATVTDQTMGGTLSGSNSNGYGPIAIIGQTRKPSLLLLGDSRCFGQADTFDASGDIGEVARWIGPSFAYSNLGVQSSSAFTSSGSNGTRRAALAQYCSHAIIQHGINDLATPRTLVQIQANLDSIRTSLGAGKVVFLTTTSPSTTSTDAWATTGNQTVKSYEATRLSLNAWKRAVPTGWAGCFEVADSIETARDSGLIKAPGYTTDGIHWLQLGYLAIASANSDVSAINRSGL
jgi:hypothetical protein